MRGCDCECYCWMLRRRSASWSGTARGTCASPGGSARRAAGGARGRRDRGACVVGRASGARFRSFASRSRTCRGWCCNARQQLISIWPTLHNQRWSYIVIKDMYGQRAMDIVRGDKARRNDVYYKISQFSYPPTTTPRAYSLRVLNWRLICAM